MNLTFSYTEKIVSFIEKISKIQGEFSALKLQFKNSKTLYDITLADSVHYSTKIEGNPLTLEQVTTTLNKSKISNANRSLKEVLNYKKARLFSEKEPVSEKSILNMHNLLLEGIVTKPLRGHYRKSQNVIRDSKTHKIVYMPPEWSDVERLMHDLLIWTKKQILLGEPSALIISGIFHFQFVTIHPFLDGNGRLARLSSYGILLKSGFKFVQFSAIEKFHEKHRRQYYENLQKYQGPLFYDIPYNQNITVWIEFWLEGLLSSAEEALARLERSSGLIEKTDPLESERLMQARILFRKYRKLKTSQYEILANIGRTQAVDDLNILIKEGFIKKLGGGRSTVYLIVVK